MGLFKDIHLMVPAARTGWQQFDAPSELVAHISAPAKRIEYVTGRLKVCIEQSRGFVPNRVMNVGSRLLCGSNSQSYWLRQVVQNGKTAADGRSYDLSEKISPLRLDLVGHVYFAKSPLRPSTLKIGFTTRIPEVRIKSLMANSGEQLILVGSFVGTLLDEQIFHFLNEKQQVAGEWYSKPPKLPNLPFLADYQSAGAAGGETTAAEPHPPTPPARTVVSTNLRTLQ